MCGIAGIVGRRDEDGMRRMLSSIRHRGPDDTGQFHDDGISLGMNRLAILDLSMKAHQPMTSHNGRYIIVYNGEVYNFKELRKLLEQNGIVFRSGSDTEVIVELFNEKGVAAFALLRGMFALAIWDRQSKKLIIARDQFGIKPVYYTRQNNTLIFASELREFLALNKNLATLSRDSLHQFLVQGYVIPPQTIYENINALEPGHYLIWDEVNLVKVKYWDLEPRQDILPESEQEVVESVREIVMASVKEQMISDVPIGVFLSGGLDSSVMVAALRNQGIQDLSTFSIGFDGAGITLDESQDALFSARHFQTKHHHITVTGRDVKDKYDHFISGLDQPSIDGLNTYLVSEHAKKNVTVALSGLGSDEIFSGYSIDRQIVNKHQRAAIRNVLAISAGIWNKFPKQVSSRILALYIRSSLLHQYASWGMINGADQVNKLLQYVPNPKSSVVHSMQFWDEKNYNQKLQRVARLHMKLFMGGRLLRDSDALSMIHSLEVRVPFLDVRLWEYVFYLPEKLKVSSFTVKRGQKYEGDISYEQAKVKSLLYNAFKMELPENFLSRSKRGFKIPIDNWLRSDLSEILNDTLSGSSTLIEKKELAGLLSKYKAGTLNWSQIWLVLVLESWYASRNQN